MPITLPDFTNPACRILTICAELVTDEKSLLKWVEDQPLMIAKRKTGKPPDYVLLVLGGPEPKHVHIDLVTKNAFGDRKPPKKLSNLTEVKKALEHLVGQKVNARI